jgi:hypothetical protein
VNNNQVAMIATAVRQAIEKCPRAELPWPDFPRGACGDVSLILGQVLDDEGITGFQYICGNKYEPSSSHAWLQNEDWIVDITADQFPDVSESVIVTNDSPWHGRWVQDKPTAGTLREYGFAQVLPLWGVHSMLKPWLSF